MLAWVLGPGNQGYGMGGNTILPLVLNIGSALNKNFVFFSTSPWEGDDCFQFYPHPTDCLCSAHQICSLSLPITLSSTPLAQTSLEQHPGSCHFWPHLSCAGVLPFYKDCTFCSCLRSFFFLLPSQMLHAPKSSSLLLVQNSVVHSHHRANLSCMLI